MSSSTRQHVQSALYHTEIQDCSVERELWTEMRVARSSLNCEGFALLSMHRSAALVEGTQTAQWKLRRIDPKLGYAGQTVCSLRPALSGAGLSLRLLKAGGRHQAWSPLMRTAPIKGTIVGYMCIMFVSLGLNSDVFFQVKGIEYKHFLLLQNTVFFFFWDKALAVKMEICGSALEG